MIQDYIFAVGSLVFAASLLPMVLNRKTKVPRHTSVPTWLLLTVFAGTQLTLGLPLAATTSLLTAAGWGFIALERA